jgi:hypothetical protein
MRVVLLQHRQARVPKDLLHGHQVHALGEDHARRKAVPPNVRIHLLRDAGGVSQGAQHLAQPARAQRHVAARVRILAQPQPEVLLVHVAALARRVLAQATVEAGKHLNLSLVAALAAYAQPVAPLGDKIQASVLSAASGAQMKLEPLADRVRRLGMQLREEDARRVREAGRSR